jgi:hypothetical protein
MRKLQLCAVLALALLSVSSSGPSFNATCTGSKYCRACKNCKYCGHCAKKGGTCGVCKSNNFAGHHREDTEKGEGSLTLPTRWPALRAHEGAVRRPSGVPPRQQEVR